MNLPSVRLARLSSVPLPDPRLHRSQPPIAESKAFRPQLPSAQPLESVDEGGD